MKKQAIWHKVCLALAVLCLLFIWGNSLQTADESSAASRGVLELLIPLLSWTGLPEDVLHTLVRKLAHMTEFAVLGMLWLVALLPQTKKASRVRWTRRGVALLICLVAASVDETIQRFVPGRSGELRDVCIDLLGSVLGVLAAMVIEMLVSRKRDPLHS